VLFLHGRDLLFEMQEGLESSEICLPLFHKLWFYYTVAAADGAVGALLPSDACITEQASSETIGQMLSFLCEQAI
jgi:hypothetical protein